MEYRAIQMDPKDNVATLLCDVSAGETVQVYDEAQSPVMTLTAGSSIPYGNKLALTDIEAEDYVVKYGEQVGLTTRAIPKGTLVHVHNVRSLNLDIPDSIIKEIISVMHIKL